MLMARIVQKWGLYVHNGTQMCIVRRQHRSRQHISSSPRRVSRGPPVYCSPQCISTPRSANVCIENCIIWLRRERLIHWDWSLVSRFADVICTLHTTTPVRRLALNGRQTPAIAPNAHTHDAGRSGEFAWYADLSLESRLDKCTTTSTPSAARSFMPREHSAPEAPRVISRFRYVMMTFVRSCARLVIKPIFA